MTAVISKAAVLEHLLKRLAAASAAVIAVSAFLYGAFLLVAVLHTATRAKPEAAIETLSAELGTLQSRYLAETQTLTPQRAKELGFVVPEPAALVYASEPSRALSFTNGGY